MPDSRHVGVWIECPADEVYAFVSDVDNLPQWAAGAGALGDVSIEFAAPNDFGVCDHVVTFPSGDVFYNPMRVIPAGPGEDRCEVVFTVRRGDLSDDQFESDAAAVAADLQTLKKKLEQP